MNGSKNDALSEHNSYIQIPHPQRIGLNKIPPRFHCIAHQRIENFIRANGIFDLRLEQTADFGIHGGFPQLFGIHFTQAFVALHADAALRFGEDPVDGFAEFFYRLLVFTAAQLARSRRARGVLLNAPEATAIIADGDRALVEFVKMVSSITRGRAYFTNTMTLGQFILMDFLKRKTRKVS